MKTWCVRAVRQYVLAVLLLWSCGERAWPWNVQFVWSHVGRMMSDERGQS